MTDAESKLIEASLAWRRLHGPTDPARNSSAMIAVAIAAEAVIRERNLRAFDGGELTTKISEAKEREEMSEKSLCGDCPPIGYPTDETRCAPCPRRDLDGGERK
jgi:hypothetical protein